MLGARLNVLEACWLAYLRIYIYIYLYIYIYICIEICIFLPMSVLPEAHRMLREA